MGIVIFPTSICGY